MHFGQAALRRRHGDAIVTAQRDLQAAAERSAVDRGDDRLRASSRSCRTTSCRLGACGGLPNSVMSAPAMKVRPSQISTTALTAASAIACCMPLTMPSRTCCDSAFTGGELRVRTAMSPCAVRSVTALIAPIGASPLEESSREKFSKTRFVRRAGIIGASDVRAESAERSRQTAERFRARARGVGFA